MKLVVVVPFYNEVKVISQLLESLLQQTSSDFSLVLVDNNSTDQTVAEITRILSKQKKFQWQIISETQKGTGAASDTGFRYAIERLQATHIARTDADCVVDKDWIREILVSFAKGSEFIAGQILPKKEPGVSLLDLKVAKLLVSISSLYCKLTRRGLEFKYPYMLAAGNNLAIFAKLYLVAGGFVRSSIDNINEDDVLAEKIRKISQKAKYNPQMKVYNSLRRLKKYGYLKTLLWYNDRSYRPPTQNEIDIR